MDFFDQLRGFVSRMLSEYRLGAYIGSAGASYDEYARSEITPEWCQDPLKRARRVSSPIMDVDAPVGSSAAVVSQDGSPSHPLNIGTVFDEKFDLAAQTVWLRARLIDHPGHIELGANESFQVRVGAKTSELNALDSGKISIGNDVGEVVRELSGVCSQLSSIALSLETMMKAVSTAAVAAAAAGGTPGSVVTYTTAVSAAMTAATIAAPAQQLAQLQIKIDSMKV